MGPVVHHGRAFRRHAGAFVRQFGAALKVGAMSLAPAVASAGLLQAVAAAAEGNPALAKAGAALIAATLSAGPNRLTNASVCLINSLPW